MLNSKSLFYLGLTAFYLMLFNMAYGEGLPPLTHSLTPVDTAINSPELRFQNLDEEIVDITDMKGKVVVVNFWATWCPPCRREMASLEKLHQATKDHNVEILAVNIGEDIDTVFSFLGQIEPLPTFTMLFDYEATSMDKWTIRGLPTTFIIRPNGTIAYRAIGGREFDHPNIVEKVLELGLK